MTRAKIARIEPIMQSDPLPKLMASAYWNDNEPKISRYVATQNLFLRADRAEQIGSVNLGQQKLRSQRKYKMRTWSDFQANKKNKIK